MAKKKKMSNDTKKNLTIASIILSAAVCAVCVFSDIAANLKNVDINIDDVFDDWKFDKAQKVIEEFQKSDNPEWNEMLSELEKEANSDANSDTFSEKSAFSSDSGKIIGSVVRVVDGDTYVLDINGEETKVRLIGVDTPESVAPDTYRTENTQEGKNISEIVKEKLPAGTKLSVEYDVSPTDKYGRRLAYLYFEDGTMVQEWLLSEGYANVATYPPNVKYAEHFKELAHTACENKVGLWSGFFSTEG